MRLSKYLFVFFLFVTLKSCSPTEPDSFTQPPAWAKDAIWYQIFAERFHNGDTTNDQKPVDMATPYLNSYPPDGWHTSDWTGDWFEQEEWAKQPGKNFNEQLQYRRYGGDLQGVLVKLDYLQELGINAIFFNPLNDASSLHKYDARNYHHIDVNFGPDPEGDKAIIAKENPNDPATWQWTAADKLFLQIVEEAHRRNIRVIMDYSWNHTGTTFWAWQDVVKNQEKSQFKDWYNITAFDNPATPENEFKYEGWLNISSLPELKKVNITTQRKIGNPYEGNINQGAKDHILAVTKRWLSPDGDTSKGIDGFRLDVADHVGLGFWRDYRKFVRAIQPNAYLVGEIWFQKWPDQLMNPAPYTQGDVFDAVMFYQVYRPARYFFAKTDFPIDARQFKDSLEFQWNRLNKANLYAMMNVSSSHDAPRLLSDFYNGNKYKFRASPHDNPNYKTGKPDEETYARLRLYLIHAYTSIGAPHIWNGEEMGMWGADDPHPRKPLMWKEFTFKPERRNNFQPDSSDEKDSVRFNQEHFDFYKKLISLRKNNPVLTTGEIEFLLAEGKTLVYKRFSNTEEIFVFVNTDDTAHELNILKPGEYTDLLTGQNVKSDKLTIDALSAMVLKSIK